MKVKRIGAHGATHDPAARRFSQEALGLDLVLDHGWVATCGAVAKMAVQVSIAAEGSLGAPVPTSPHA